MNVAIYLHPARANWTNQEEDYLLAPPELHEFLNRERARSEGVLVPAPELRQLVKSAKGEVAEHLRDTLNHFEDAHMVLLVGRDGL